MAKRKSGSSRKGGGGKKKSSGRARGKAKRTAAKSRRTPQRTAAKSKRKSVVSKKAKQSRKTAHSVSHPAGRRASHTSKNHDVFGEGNYTASREFICDQTNFVKRNRQEIPKLGQEAGEALDGPEGGELREAEQKASSRGASEGNNE